MFVHKGCRHLLPFPSSHYYLITAGSCSFCCWLPPGGAATRATRPTHCNVIITSMMCTLLATLHHQPVWQGMHSNAFSHVFFRPCWSGRLEIDFKFVSARLTLDHPCHLARTTFQTRCKKKQHGGSSRHDIHGGLGGTTPTARCLMVGDWCFEIWYVLIMWGYVSLGHFDKDTEWIWMTLSDIELYHMFIMVSFDMYW